MSNVIAPFFFLAVSAGLFFTYIDQAYKDLQAVRSLEVRLDDALTGARELTTVREGLLAKYGSFSDRDLERISKLLPDRIDNIHLIIDIDRMASAYGMRVRNFNFGGVERGRTPSGTREVQAESPLGTASITFATSGTYQDLIAFLRSVETSLRMLEVRSVVVTPQPADEENGANETRYNYTISVDAYWLK